MISVNSRYENLKMAVTSSLGSFLLTDIPRDFRNKFGFYKQENQACTSLMKVEKPTSVENLLISIAACRISRPDKSTVSEEENQRASNGGAA